MKITFVTDTYAPQANGVATTLHCLVNGLRDRGHDIDVIRPAVLACDEEGMRVPSVGLPGYPELRVGLPMRMALQLRWMRNPPNVIYVATESPLGASAITAARALKIPAASGFHTNFQQYMEHYRLPGLKRAAMSYLRRVHNRSQRTFVPSYDVIDELNRQGFENLELLPKGVDTRRFSPKKRSLLLRSSWGVRGGSPVGLYVGRIAAEKNLPLVVRCFDEMQRRIPDFRGVFVGDGPKLKELRKSHPQYLYTGVKYGDELAEYYASADVFVFPSLTETFGNVVLEAMASGLSTVAYDYAAARQNIVDRVNGYSVAFDDERAFIEAAVFAAAAPAAARLREEARRSARHVRWSKVVKRFEKALAAMASSDAGDAGDAGDAAGKGELPVATLSELDVSLRAERIPGVGNSSNAFNPSVAP